MDWHRWGEEHDEQARRRWKDEPLKYDFGSGVTKNIRGTFIVGSTNRDKSAPAVLYAVEGPSIIVSIVDLTIDGKLWTPLPGHCITRIDTQELYEVVHREKDRCFRAHGTYRKELRIFLEQIKKKIK